MSERSTVNAQTSARSRCCSAAPRPSARSRIMSGTGVLEALQLAGRRCACLRSGRARPRRAEARRLRALLHRAARPPRRGRQRAGRARAARHPLHRLRRDGLGDRDGQGDDQARLARRGPADAALRAPAPTTSRRASSVRARARRARPAADREAAARGLVDRHHQGRRLFADAGRGGAGRAVRRRRAVRGVHRGRRGHLPGARRRRRARGRCRWSASSRPRAPTTTRTSTSPTTCSTSARAACPQAEEQRDPAHRRSPPTARSAAAAGAAPT